MTGDHPVTIDKYPGRELTFTTDKEAIVLRAYLAGDRVYVIGANRLEKEAIANATEKFFNSFRLLQSSATTTP